MRDDRGRERALAPEHGARSARRLLGTETRGERGALEGVLVLGELGRYSVWAAERRLRGWFGAETWKHARFWSRKELEALARGAGLDVIETRGSVFYPPSDLGARLVAPFEPALTRLDAPFAAFLAVGARAET